MGLASKLQAAQAAGGLVMAMGAPQGAGMPGAPMYPSNAGAAGAPYGAPYGAAPSAPPAPYGQQPMPGAPGSMGMMPAPQGMPAGPYQPASGAYGAAQAPPQAMPGTGFGAAPGIPPPGAPMPGSDMSMQPGTQGNQQQQQQYQTSAYPMGAPAAGAPMQQQPLGMPGPAAGPAAGGAPGGMAGAIHAKLSSVVAANQLQRFYPPQALQALAGRLDARVNFRDLAARWRMPVEMALDLASLALYDIVLFADDSGSMAFEENGERVEDLKMIGSKVAEIATLFDDDGILVRFMNSDKQGNGIRSAADVSALLAGVQYSGLTPLATSMHAKVLQPIVFSLAASGQLAKPVLVLTITDGEPTDNPTDKVVQVIKESRSRLAAPYGPKAVAFEFAQVGKDQRAQAFLGQLDKHPEVGNSIDCTSYYELESVEYQRRGIQLSPELWLVKIMVGSIDPSYDEGDE
uniref:VWFA domain-containing protein n=2 Tax=Tetradesmus obliquus TaxID=3088 RepID=A0A383VTZ6_TETOB|eukprot:jgi/Sobl393_1/16654/SZX68968.1